LGTVLSSILCTCPNWSNVMQKYSHNILNHEAVISINRLSWWIATYQHNYRVIKKSLCTWWLQ
jgi:hypothetical protein